MVKPAKFKPPKPDHCTLELCAKAGEILKEVGFIKTTHSLKSVATYYHWPDRDDVLRVAEHSIKSRTNGLNRVAAKITFGNDQPLSRPGTLRISDEKVIANVAAAIGRYFLNSKPSQ